MGIVVDIRKSEDLPTRAQNALRYAIELGEWKAKWRAAEAEGDYDEMDRLNSRFEMVGLP